MTKSEFVREVLNIAKKECKKRGYGDTQAWVCVSQAACESAYGTSKLMKNANAYFGIKATSSWVKASKYGGKVFKAKTNECYDGKTLTRITDCFRAYDSMEDSVSDYFDLLENKRYRDALKVNSVEEAITIIKNGGYATAPNYVSTIMKFYNDCITLAGETVPKTETKKYSLEEVAREVISGKWGNGSDRMRRLNLAGYNYSEVQKEVNRLLRR